MKILVPEQLRKLDEKAVSEYGIPSILLMEHAALSLAERIKELTFAKNIVIVCGPGNNGGDGLALARLLTGLDRKWSVFLAASPEKLSEDGKTYYNILKALHVELLQMDEMQESLIEERLKEADLIVDALFGTGLSRKIEGKYKEIIEKINRSLTYVISVDCPSGIDAETGKVLGRAVKANETHTFVAPKLGLYLYPAIDYTGEVRIVDIGMPQQLVEETSSIYWDINKEEMTNCLPMRYTRSNKGTYGKVLTIGGQMGMSGAIILASSAALKVGAGLVTAAVPQCIHAIVASQLIEVMTLPLKDREGHFDQEAVLKVSELILSKDIVLIGPGLGRTEAAKKLVLQVVTSDKPCLIDADGLVVLREMLERLKERKSPVILTPHPGEMAALTGLSIEAILENPIKVARDFAMKYQVVVVLKTERTLVVEPQGTVYINTRGNSGMAKGGSGDVLAGVIVGLMAQGLLPVVSAQLGVYLHSRGGDLLKKEKTEYTFLPTDLFEGIQKAFKELIGH